MRFSALLILASAALLLCSLATAQSIQFQSAHERTPIYTTAFTQLPHQPAVAGVLASYDDIRLEWRDMDLPSGMVSVVQQGNIAYCAFLYGIHVIDVSNPAHPIKLGELPMVSSGPGMALYDHYLYIPERGYWGNGINIVDVADPADPRKIGLLASPVPEVRLIVRGNYLFAVLVNPYTWMSYLRVYSLANPETPQMVSSLDLVTSQGNEHVFDVTGDDRYLYMTTNGTSSLIIVDVGDPAAPVLVSSIASDAWGYTVAVDGNLACVAASAKGLFVFDITDRTAPVQVASYHLPNFVRIVSLTGTIAYVISPVGELYKVDLSNPSAPVLTGEWQPPLEPNQDAWGWLQINALGNTAWVVRMDEGLQILDFSSGYTPTVLGAYETRDQSADIAVNGSHAYVISRGTGLHVLDLANPTNPQAVSTYPSTAARVVTNAGSTVYLGLKQGARCEILDASDPANPVLLGSIATGGPVSDLVVRDTLLYLLDSVQGLRVLSIASPASPQEIGALSIPGGTYLGLGDSVLVISAGLNGCAFVNVTDPANPAIIASVPPGGYFEAAATDDHYAYCFAGHLLVYDLYSPSHNELIGSHSWSPGAFHDAQLRGPYLFSSDGVGVDCYNISKPRTPSLDMLFSPTNYAGALAIRDTTMYLTGGLGLLTFNVNKCCSQLTGDINISGVTDLADLSALIYYMLENSIYGTSFCPAALNINGRGIVDLADLSTLIGYLTGLPASLGTCP